MIVDQYRQQFVAMNPHRVVLLDHLRTIDRIEITNFVRQAHATGRMLTLAILGPESDHRLHWDPEYRDAFLPRLYLETGAVSLRLRPKRRPEQPCRPAIAPCPTQ